MATTIRGHIKSGVIVPDAPLDLPDGAAVNVRVETLDESPRKTAGSASSKAFFGIWSDREDMADSSAWVEQERLAWHNRLGRQA